MKKRKNKGFTVFEMMVCVATLVLVCLICTTGMNMALKSYNDSMFETQSQMLESMLNSSMGDVLRFSDNVSVISGIIIFSNSAYNVVEGTLRADAEGHVILQKNASETIPLVATTVYVDEMYVSDMSFTYNPSTHVITGSYKIKSRITSGSRDVNFTFRSIIES